MVLALDAIVELSVVDLNVAMVLSAGVAGGGAPVTCTNVDEKAVDKLDAAFTGCDVVLNLACASNKKDISKTHWSYESCAASLEGRLLGWANYIW